MATTWQFRRGTQSQNDAFTGAPGEITVDMDTRTIRLHDGVTAGGWSIYTQGNTLDAEAIFFNNDNTNYTGTDVQAALGETDVFLKSLQTNSHTHSNKVVLDNVVSSGSGAIITTPERSSLKSAVQDGSNVGGGEGQVYKTTTTNTSSFRSLRAGSNVTIDTDVTTPDEITINATGTIGQDAILIDYDPVGTEYVSTNVQAALTETDTRLKSVEGLGTVPVGGIMMWSGAIGSVPSNWVLCDGRAPVKGLTIPDLTDRFIVGAGGSYAVGAQGGEATSSHTHSVNGTSDSTVLTVAQIPAHSHNISPGVWMTHDADRGGSEMPSTHSSAGTRLTTQNTGGNQGHTHGISLTTSGASATENRPPYYALAFIIYTG